MSWILPEDQICKEALRADSYRSLTDDSDDGDPSEDVATASVLFLVDGKLALLQPWSDENGERKYDMRVLAQSVEYYVQMRDQPTVGPSILDDDRDAKADDDVYVPGTTPSTTLRDSLWIFDGSGIRVWTDLHDVLRSHHHHHLADTPHAVAPSTQISVDFYPASILLNKGIVLGVESELIQRRDLRFAFFRTSTRVRDDVVT